MNISKSLLSAMIVTLAALLVFLLLIYSVPRFPNVLSYFQKSSAYRNNVVLFYGKACQQCMKVDNFLRDNNVEQRVAFIRLEVFSNQTNAAIMSDKAQICGLDYQQIGVPFLWDGASHSCIIGYADVIHFFQNKIDKRK